MRPAVLLCMFPVFLVAALSVGCTMTSSIAFTHTHQPICLGNVAAIYESESKPPQFKRSLSIESITDRRNFDSIEHADSAAMRKDAALLSMLENEDERILVHEVRFGSVSLGGFLLFVPFDLQTNWTGVEGGVAVRKGSHGANSPEMHEP